ncbi:MAG: YibE/F family protein [Ruminococcaceae bacterium]|nr:YibE/F family protein [Oscillospiraceae bacterium]
MTKRILAAVLIMLVTITCCLPVHASGSDAVPTSGSDAAGQQYFGSADQTVTQVLDGNYVSRVLEIISDETTELGAEYGYSSRLQKLKVEVLQGPKEGCTAYVIYDLTDTWGGDSGSKPAEVGDKVIVQLEEGADGLLIGYVTMFVRHNAIIILGVLFVLLLVFLGGTRGLRSLVALLVTCLGLICVMIPMILNGVSPVLASVLACIFSIAATLIIVYGLSVKSLAAGIGSIGGVAVAGVIVLIMNSVMNMTGLIDDTSMYLAQSVSEMGSLDLTGILFAAIIISVLGGTIDVSVSIASSLEELKLNAPDMDGAQLMRSGIKIGVDIMGASLNTLILSYLGCAIHIVLIFYTYQSPLIMVFNDEMIVCELLRALAGSSALLFTVPITAYVSAMMMNRGRFGKFSWDCFASVVIARRIRDAVREGWQKKKSDRTAESSVPSEPEETVEPENLYQLAQQRSRTMNFDKNDEL